LPRAVQRRALQRQLFDLGVTADFDLIERLRATAEQPMAVAEGKYVVRDEDGRLRAESGPATEFSGATQLVKLRGTSGSAEFAGFVFAWEKARARGADFSAGLNLEQFDADKVGNRIVLRHWQAGDRFQPIGAEAPRKLQDVFTNLKTPRAERRRRVLATTAAGEIFWVQGVRIGEKFKLREQTNRRLVWRWKER
jgi:tRNA(Ile)-lysidine synthase